jgi:hypothetical protein
MVKCVYDSTVANAVTENSPCCIDLEGRKIMSINPYQRMMLKAMQVNAVIRPLYRHLKEGTVLTHRNHMGEV